MKKRFFLKIALLFFLVFVVCQLTRMLVPSYWCGAVIAAKEEQFFKQEPYDLVFLGTSRINHGVNPKVFDGTFKKNTNKKIRSFNFGISGASAGEVFNLANDVIDADDDNLKYMVVELCSVGTALGKKFCIENLHTNRNKYWLDLSSYKHAVGNLLGYKNKNMGWGKRLKYAFNYTANYIENIFNVGMLDSFVDYYAVAQAPNYGIGKRGDGYNNIETIKQRGVKKARKGFLKDKSLLKQKKKNSKLFFGEKMPKKGAINKPYVTALKALITKAESRKIKLIFIAPPLMSAASYKELSTVFSALPPRSRINLAGSDKYPQLYKLEHTWDGNHLNHEGTSVFSVILANQLSNKLKI